MPDKNFICPWAKSELEISYHDNEWGFPKYDDRVLFEYLILEGMQSGLSWGIILKKREAMREAFYNFDFYKIAKLSEKDIEDLINNKNIIRNRLKLKALINNAVCFINVIKEYGSFCDYIWRFVDYKPIINKNKTLNDVSDFSEISVSMSKELKKKGFKFVGPKICYSFMQATGMVNDHLISCRVYSKVNNASLGIKFKE